LRKNVLGSGSRGVSDADSSEGFRLGLLDVTDCKSRNRCGRTSDGRSVAEYDRDPRLRSDVNRAWDQIVARNDCTDKYGETHD
jgi:hypothetical protein